MCECACMDHISCHDIDNTGKLNIANADLIPCAQMAPAPDLQPDGGNSHAWHGLKRRIRSKEQPR